MPPPPAPAGSRRCAPARPAEPRRSCSRGIIPCGVRAAWLCVTPLAIPAAAQNRCMGSRCTARPRGTSSLSQRLCRQPPSPLQTTAIAATTHRAFPGDGLQTPQRRALCPTQPYKPHSAVPFTQRDPTGHSRMGRQKISHLTCGRESHSLCIAEPEGNGAGATGNALVTPLLAPSLNLYSQAPL